MDKNRIIQLYESISNVAGLYLVGVYTMCQPRASQHECSGENFLQSRASLAIRIHC